MMRTSSAWLAIRSTSTLEVRCHEHVSTMRPGNRSAARRRISAALGAGELACELVGLDGRDGCSDARHHPFYQRSLRTLMTRISMAETEDPTRARRRGRLEAAAEPLPRARHGRRIVGLPARPRAATTCTSRSPVRGRTARSSSRRLKGLEQAIGLTIVDPIRDERGWAFTGAPGTDLDPLHGFDFLSQVYDLTSPGPTTYRCRCSSTRRRTGS